MRSIDIGLGSIGEMQAVLTQYEAEVVLLRESIQYRLEEADFTDGISERSWRELQVNLDSIYADLREYQATIKKELALLERGYARLIALRESVAKHTFAAHLEEQIVLTVRQTRLGCYDFDETMESVTKVHELLERG